MNNSQGGNGYGGLTQTAGTIIQFVVPGRNGNYTRITRLTYLDASTAHTLTLMRCIGRTIVGGAAASGQAVVTFVADPGLAISNALAANDFIVLQEQDGNQRVYKVSSVPGSYPGNVTMTTNLVSGCIGGESIWNFGVTGDTGVDGLAHPFFTSGSGSAEKTWTDSDAGIVAAHTKSDPILFNSNNATNAGKLSNITWCYTLT